MSLTALDDQQLVIAAKDGNAAAFDELVRRHTTRMFRVAVRITGDPVDAEDVVQESWIAAWRGLSAFRAEAAVSTWLYRVVTNTALGVLRRRKPTVPLDPEVQYVDLGDDPESSVLRRERVAAVLDAIASLEPSQRVPLVLRELEGMSYEDIAAVLQVDPPALRSRLHRARVALLAKLKELR